MGCANDVNSRDGMNQTLEVLFEPEGDLQRGYEEAMKLVSSLLDMCNHALKLPTAPPPDQPPATLSSCSQSLNENLRKLRTAVTSLTRSYSKTESELHSQKNSNSLLKSVLKARENELKMLGEDYHAYATQRVLWNDNRKRFTTFSSAQRNLPSEVSVQYTEILDEEESLRSGAVMSRTNTFLESIQKSHNLEKFLLVLHLDSERQSENQQSAIRLWSHLAQSALLVRGMAESELENVTLEGFLKAKLLKSNPIIDYLSTGVIPLDEHMPPHELFPVLFQTLDSVFELGQVGKSFPELVLEYLSITLPIKSKMHQFLGSLFLSLRTFYNEGDPYAVFFARILRVFHPDPLLDSVAQALLSINAVLANKTAKKEEVLSVRMTDEMTGGNIYLVSALECAFTLPMSADLKLFQHFLTCLKPAEITDLEWAAFVIACKAKSLMIDFTIVATDELQDYLAYLKHALDLQAVVNFLPPEPLSPDALAQLFNSRVYEEIKDLFFLPKGSALDAFLQVYDLYVESLVSVLTNISEDATVTKPQLDTFLLQFYPILTQEERGALWETALNLTSEEATLSTTEGIHLAIITSDIPAVAVKPLLMTKVDIKLKHTRTMSFGYKHGRLSACFPSEEKAHRRQLPTQRRRNKERRVTRALSRPVSFL